MELEPAAASQVLQPAPPEAQELASTMSLALGPPDEKRSEPGKVIQNPSGEPVDNFLEMVGCSPDEDCMHIV